jgi:mono/diheme cytochrome c family protein
MAIEDNHRRQALRVIVAALIAGSAAVPAPRAVAAADRAKIAAGEAVYNTYCSNCHGDGLMSSGQTFDLRRLDADARSRFETSVLMGKGQMPPWQGVLTGDEIDQIWHYIRDNAYQK